MKYGLQIRIIAVNEGFQKVQGLIRHPMETGYRKNRISGDLIPANYIQNLFVNVDGVTYFEMALGKNVSRNPYFSFRCKTPILEMQMMSVRWVDNNGRAEFYDFDIKYDSENKFTFRGDKAEPKLLQLTDEATPVCRQNIAISGGPNE